jgi:hypothetical protein
MLVIEWYMHKKLKYNQSFNQMLVIIYIQQICASFLHGILYLLIFLKQVWLL